MNKHVAKMSMCKAIYFTYCFVIALAPDNARAEQETSASKRIFISLKSEPFDVVIARLSEITGLRMWADNELSQKSITLKVENASIEHVIDTLRKEISGLHIAVYPSGTIYFYRERPNNIDLVQAPFCKVVDLFSFISGKNIFLLPGMQENVVSNPRSINNEEEFRQYVEMCGYVLERSANGKIYLIQDPMAHSLGSMPIENSVEFFLGTLNLDAEVLKRAKMKHAKAKTDVDLIDAMIAKKNKSFIDLIIDKKTDRRLFSLASTEIAALRAAREKLGATIIKSVADELPSGKKIDYTIVSDINAIVPTNYCERINLAIAPNKNEPKVTLSLKRATLEEAAKQLNKVTGVPIVIDKPKMGRREKSGTSFVFKSDRDISQIEINALWKAVPLSEVLTDLQLQIGELFIKGDSASKIVLSNEDALNIYFENVSIHNVVEMLGKATGQNIECAPELECNVTIKAREIALKPFLYALSDLYGWRVNEKGGKITIETAPDAPLASPIALWRLRQSCTEKNDEIETILHGWGIIYRKDAIKIRDMRRSVIVKIVEGKPIEESISEIEKERAEYERKASEFVVKLRDKLNAEKLRAFLGLVPTEN